MGAAHQADQALEYLLILFVGHKYILNSLKQFFIYLLFKMGFLISLWKSHPQTPLSPLSINITFQYVSN